MKLKNIAIVAHVDHGKTTLVDELLKQSGLFSAHEQVAERVMDSGELEKERGITIKAKNCAIRWKDTKINLLDTPGHADFGGEVERSLMMVDGILLLVDASEGPLPQTRFVLSKALERDIRVAVFINKVDRPDQRIEEVQSEVEDLLLELASQSGHDIDLDIPFLYGSGRTGYASNDKDRREGNLHPMLDFLVSDYYPAPKVDKDGPAQLLVTNLSYSNYLGALMVGRIQRGTIHNGKQLMWIGAEAKNKTFKVTSLQIYDGLGMSNVESVKYVPTSDPKVFILKARGELQVAVVFEEIRRAGFELMIARPQVITKEENGQLFEPFERLVLDVPNESTGAITEKMASRKGKLEAMIPFGEGRTRMEFTVPSRGLIGYRSTFLTDTKGQGLMSSYFVGYEPHVGKMLSRQNGALISDRAGKITPYALFNLLSSGRQFVLPGEQAYEGQVVGEHTRPNDLNINVCREKHLSSVRTAGKDENIILPPIPPRTLDWALDWIDDDEWVEVTPKSIRIRKKELSQNQRTVVR